MALVDSNGVAITTTTAGDGSFVFSDVEPGAYFVQETDPAGFTSTTSNDVHITLIPGGAAAANFGDLLTGTVSGIIFNDLTLTASRTPARRALAA